MSDLCTFCQTCVHVGKECLLEISLKLFSKDVWRLELYQVTLTHLAKHPFSSLCEDSLRGRSDSSFSSLREDTAGMTSHKSLKTCAQPGESGSP